MPGRNTSIAKSRLGAPRFPPRPPEPPAEVKVYYMPIEEVIKKYGPPRRPLRRSCNGAIDYQSIAAAIRTSTGPMEAADLLGIKLEDLQRYIRHYKIQPRYGLSIKTKEEDEMGFEVFKGKDSKSAAGELENHAPVPTLAKEARENQPAGSRLTVARVVEIREETIEDLDDLTRIIDLAIKDFAPSERILNLLTWNRDQYQQTLNRINHVFSTTEVKL